MHHRVILAVLYARRWRRLASSSSSTSPATTRNDAPGNLSMLISRPRSSAVVEKNCCHPAASPTPRVHHPPVVLSCPRGRYIASAVSLLKSPFKTLSLSPPPSHARLSPALTDADRQPLGEGPSFLSFLRDLRENENRHTYVSSLSFPFFSPWSPPANRSSHCYVSSSTVTPRKYLKNFQEIPTFSLSF